MAVLSVLGFLILLGVGVWEMVAPFAVFTFVRDFTQALPSDTLRTLRMLRALLLLLILTLTYATLAAKSRRAEIPLIPPLDFLQLVPILGYPWLTVIFFISGVLGNLPRAGARCDLHESGRNMALSFDQALRTVPSDLDEASHSSACTLLAARSTVCDAAPYL